MPVDQDQLAALLHECEARLLESRRGLDEVLDRVRRMADLSRDSAEPGEPAAPAIKAVLDSHRDELVSMVLAALETAPKARASRDDYMRALVRRDDDGSYRLGRRRVTLTDTEQQLLDMLWQAMPEPVSRDDVLDRLYPEGGKPTAGAIDVFVSKLRQKLKLASGGREFFESVRGRGWALKPELCRHVKGEAEERRRA